MRSMSRRLMVVPAAVLSAAAVAAPGPAGAAPATATPAIQLVTATTHTTYQRFPGDPIFFLDLGVHALAGDRPFEIRATRASYADPVVAYRVTRNGHRETRTRLPDGLVTDLFGLTGFLHVRMTAPDGSVVLERDTSYCPNSWSAVRSRPNAPATSPYPQVCAQFTPFALTGVWGLQAGWSTQLFVDLAEPLDGPDGDYTITVSISPQHRAAFGIPAAQAESTVTFTVETLDVPDPRARTATARSATARAERAGPGVPPQPARTRPRASASVPGANARPDLRALPAFGVTVGSDFGDAGGDLLSFSANVWNGGPSPLVVDGFRRPGTDVMDAVQYFYNSRGQEVGSAPTGTLEYDTRDGHNHWHFTDFATYRLLDASRQVAVRSGKEAFCLAPTDPIDLLAANALWQPSSIGLGTACGGATALSIREVLPVGWGDTYIQSLPGQAFDISGLPNGTYYIEVLANPENRLYETSTANNASLRKVILGGVPGARTVQVPPVGLVDVP